MTSEDSKGYLQLVGDITLLNPAIPLVRRAGYVEYLIKILSLNGRLS